MVVIEHPRGAYCIDRTEVTRAAYQAFLDTNPDPASMPAPCEWKTSHEPRASGQNCEPKHYEPSLKPTHPVVCIDWCDAKAFCEQTGKRLCGRPGGGKAPFDLPSSASHNEWYHACSDGGSRAFPYGSEFNPTACFSDSYDPGVGADADPVAVGSLPGCEGPEPGLFDLSGNVMEWEDSCEKSPDPSADQCHDRGGSFWDDAVRCDALGPPWHTRSYFNKNIGFRCCADPSG